MDRDNRWDSGRTGLADPDPRRREWFFPPSKEAIARRLCRRPERRIRRTEDRPRQAPPLHDDRGRRRSRLLQLPFRPCPGAHRGVDRTGFLGSPGTAFPALTGFVCLSEYDETFVLPIGFPRKSHPRISGGSCRRGRSEPVALCGNGKIRACHLFLQRRQRDPLPRRGAMDAAPFPPGSGDLRQETRDERSGGDRSSWSKRIGTRAVRFHRPQLRQSGHGGSYRASCRRPSLPWRPSTPASAGWWTPFSPPAAVLLITADHGNCEQMLDDAGGCPDRPQHQSGSPAFWSIRSTAGSPLRQGILADLAPTILALMGLHTAGRR